jgi:uncharacterized protein with PQ loop repeat
VTAHAIMLGFGYLGAALGVVMVVPQITRIVRHPSLPGVSPTTWMLSTLGCLMWLTYGLRAGAAPQIPGNLLLIGGALTIVVLVPSQHSRARRLLALAGCALGLLVLAFSMPAHDVGYLAFAIGLCSSWPQVFDSVQTWRAGRTSGVSVSSWKLRIASQVAWLTYAVGTSDRPVLIGACVALSTATLLVVLESTARASVTTSLQLAAN